ncbi:MAG: phage Gp37/Gp68 family protein [Casimicrobium sp.]
MAKQTNIVWTKSTFNPWMGCTGVSRACDHCYAEALMGRWLKIKWGTGEPRVRTSPTYWRAPRAWNAAAPSQNFAGIRGFWPVFCASLADVFDNEVDPQWRLDLWELVRATPNLTWQILTKRIGNARKMLPADWGNGYANVWLGATVCDQTEALRDVVKLRAVPAAVRFVSVEPMLGSIDLEAVPRDGDHNSPPGRLIDMLDWVICGGERCAQSRPMHPNGPRQLRDQCVRADKPFLFKQWGDWSPGSLAFGNELPANALWDAREHQWAEGEISYRVGVEAAGISLDGRVWQQFPAAAVASTQLPVSLVR